MVLGSPPGLPFNPRAGCGRVLINTGGMAGAGEVTAWSADEGSGVIDSADTPGGCWAHFSAITGMTGYVPVGSTTAEQTITITNVSGVPQLMSGTGGGAGVFGGAQNCQGTTLAPGKSCQMFYAFSPVKVGSVTGSTSGTWNGYAFSFHFSGFGTPQFLITPTSLAFGKIKVGHTSKQQSIDIENLANKPVVMSGAGGGAGVFGGGPELPGRNPESGPSLPDVLCIHPGRGRDCPRLDQRDMERPAVQPHVRGHRSGVAGRHLHNLRDRGGAG